MFSSITSDFIFERAVPRCYGLPWLAVTAPLLESLRVGDS